MTQLADACTCKLAP